MTQFILLSQHVVTSFQGVPYSSLSVGVPREIYPDERRVALTPQNVALLRKKGFAEVLIEHDAGTHAQFLNRDYESAGATLASREHLFAQTDIMLKVRPPLLDKEIEHIKHGSTLISFLHPKQNKELVEALAKRDVNAFAMDMIPRISRAQTFDALRSDILNTPPFFFFAESATSITVLCLTSRVTRLFWKLPTTLVDT
jgi:H+-translocating NAD(P) transhydrogenase